MCSWRVKIRYYLYWSDSSKTCFDCKGYCVVIGAQKSPSKNVARAPNSYVQIPMLMILWLYWVHSIFQKPHFGVKCFMINICRHLNMITHKIWALPCPGPPTVQKGNFSTSCAWWRSTTRAGRHAPLWCHLCYLSGRRAVGARLWHSKLEGPNWEGETNEFKFNMEKTAVTLVHFIYLLVLKSEIYPLNFGLG